MTLFNAVTRKMQTPFLSSMWKEVILGQAVGKHLLVSPGLTWA